MRGLVVGRALLFPPDGDVAAAVDIAAELVHGRSRDDRQRALGAAPRYRARPTAGRSPSTTTASTAGSTPACMPAGWPRGRAARSTPGEWEHVVVPLSRLGHAWSRRRAEAALGGPGGRLRRADRRRLRGPRTRASPSPPRVGRHGSRCAARGPLRRRTPRSATSPWSEVPVELRGAGSASREVRNFGTPGVLDADSIIACEVITPAGNWSSYPPHKHDEERDRAWRPSSRRSTTSRCRSEAGAPTVDGADPIGYQRVYGTAGAPHRRAGRGPHRRRRAGARTAGTDRRWRRPGTTCTTST